MERECPPFEYNVEETMIDAAESATDGFANPDSTHGAGPSSNGLSRGSILISHSAVYG